MSEPTAVLRSDFDNAILSQMFCIAEHHGIREPKFRLSGDLTKSNVDKTAQMSETYCHQGPDPLCRVGPTPTYQRCGGPETAAS